MIDTQSRDDHLWRQLKTIPAFRALLRAVEARFYQKIELPQPVLDVGCGDGHFAQVTFDGKITAGIDPWWGPLNKGHRSGMYEQVYQCLGNQMPFPDHTFASAFSNSVLEHIPEVQAVLNETSRVMQPGGRLVITMPSQLFTKNLGGAALLERIGLKELANKYRTLFNKISRHVHTDPPEIWAARLAQAGFVIERWQYYFSTDALRALEIGHAQGLPSAIMHALTGHWLVAPWKSSLRWTDRWLRPFYEESFPEEGAYLLFVARKQADGPLQAQLPAANPFTLDELADEMEPLVAHTWENNLVEPVPPEPPGVEQQPSQKSAGQKTAVSSSLLTISMLLASLTSAFIGQSILNGQSADPGSGVAWFGFSLLPLLFLVWQRRTRQTETFSWPRLTKLSWRSLLVFPALLLSLFAYRLGREGITPPAGWAIFLWLVAIGVGGWALAGNGRFPGFTLNSRTIFNGGLLFLGAVLLRTINLTGLPFILDGSEASIGLEASRIADGLGGNPFGVSWLTNPTLPFYLLALPVKLFGPSVTAIRFFSPLIGALTVVATFLIGRKLYGHNVGLVAAILLTGSHFHLQYSRLGMTNIWDPLLALLAMGSLAIAWQAGEAQKRPFWLLTGLFWGMSAYFFTASHLLPLMGIAIFIYWVLIDRRGLREHAGHIIAAGTLALIIALPQLLYYNQNDLIFMERARSLGIMADQTDWLAQEAALTGQSETSLLWQQIKEAALAFNHTLDNSPAYRPSRPLLGFWPGLLFVIGLATAVFHWRRLSYTILTIWVAVTVIFGGALLLQPPNSHRLVIVIPALCLLAAIALVKYSQLLGTAVRDYTSEHEFALATQPSPGNIPLWQQLTTPWFSVAFLIGLSLLLAFNDTVFYFGPYRQSHAFADRNTEVADNMGHYLRELEGEWTACFFGPPSMYVSFPTIPFLATNFQQNENLFDVANQEPGDEIEKTAFTLNDNNQIFLFLPERADELIAIQSRYPDGQLKQFAGYHANPLFFAYEVKR